MKLSWIAETLSQTYSGQACEITGVSIDSRTVKPGELFVVLVGDTYDGHDFVEEAATNGAVAVLVMNKVSCNIPQLIVPDTAQALIQLARQWRQRFTIPIVAITGSCGKTSTRALTHAVLSTAGETLASIKSFNNSIGVPLTLLGLRPSHQYAVLEVGTNHPGEIIELTKLIKPTIALITLAAPSHLAGFGDLAGIAREKGDIYSNLPENGIGIINQDDEFAEYWRDLIEPHQVITFGLKKDAQIEATDLKFDTNGCATFLLKTPNAAIETCLKVMGKHNIYNASAAAAVGYALSIPIQKIKEGLEAAQAEHRRLVRLPGIAQARIIDDSYNANPASVKAAIEVLSHTEGVPILVLGDMLELGEMAHQFHAEIGNLANQMGIQHLFAFGELSIHAARSFGSRGQHFSSQEELVDALRPLLNNQVTVLVKGSNSMGMHQVAQSLLEE